MMSKKALGLSPLKLTQNKREQVLAWLFVSPATIAFIVFMFWPLIYTLYLSFFKWNMVSPTKKSVGFANYIAIFQDPLTYQLLWNTLLYIVILVVFNFILPYVLAFGISFVIKKFKGFYKSIIFMPSLISLVVGAIVFQWVFNPISGPLSIILKSIGIIMPTWSKTPGLVIFVLSLITVYKAFGYNFLVLLSGVSSVPTELIEAAKLEKVSERRIFMDIVVPLTSSTAVYVLLMTIVQGMQFAFTPIKVLTEGGPNNASSNIIYGVYQQAFTYFDTGRASALSMVTMVIFLLLLYLEFRYVEKGVYYEN